MSSHIVDGCFQSDKYPACPPGKVPLSVEDPTAQDLLWEYASRRESVDAEFAQDLRSALAAAGYMPEQESVYAFNAYFGRMGSLDSVFLATAERVQAIIGKHIYFGEVLGKHSEISLDIKSEHIKLVASSPSAVKFVREHLRGSIGHNPFHYCEDERDPDNG